MSTHLEQKITIFLEITKALNKHGIIPALYGSLGVYQIIGQLDEIEDIDMIIPNIYLDENKRFPELMKIMGKIGYKQDKRYPHEFIKAENQISFEPESELIKDTGVDLKNLKTIQLGGVKFKELSKKHFLATYKKNLTRWEKKIKKIKLKIRALEQE